MRVVTNVVFDLDGTLIDSSAGVIEAANYALTEKGYRPRSGEVISRYIGYPLQQMFADFGASPADELIRLFRIRAADSVVAAARPMAGAEAVLFDLKSRGRRLAIATTKARSQVVAILRKLKWDALFGAVVGGDEVTRVKPDPETIHLALKRLRARPEDSLVVGDTVNDVLAARGVPMKAVAVASPFGSETALAALKPDYFLKSLTELSSLPELAGAVGAD